MKNMDQEIKKILKDILNSIEENKPYRRIMTVEDLSRYVGLSKSTIYKLTSQRIIPHLKPFGRTIYFDRRAVDEFFLKHPIGTIDILFENALIKLQKPKGKLYRIK